VFNSTSTDSACINYDTAIDYINSLEDQNQHFRTGVEQERNKRMELERQLKEMRQMQHQGTYPPPPNGMPQSPIGYAPHYNNGVNGSTEPPRTLPPLINGAMQDVQYSDNRG